MALPQEAVVSKADWQRIQSLLNQPKAKVPTREELIEQNLLNQFSRAEDKLLLMQQRKLHAERKLREQAKEEHLNMLAAEERELQRQDLQQAVDKANLKRFHQSGCVQKFHRAVQKTHVQKENEALKEIQQEQRRLAAERKRQSEEDMRSRLKEALRQEQEKAHQRQLDRLSVADFHTKQMKEKKQLKEKQRQQEREERDVLRHLDELHAQELRDLAVKKAESKKNCLKYRLEDISSKRLDRQREAETMNMVEKARLRVESDIAQKQKQRKDDRAEKFRKRQTPIEMVREKLAVSKKEQAATVALREELKLSKALAEQDAKMAKQWKEKQQQKIAMVNSIAAHREAKIQEKKQKERAEQMSDLDQFQAQKKSTKLFLEKQKQKTQTIYKNNLKYRDFNINIMAEKYASVEQLKRKEQEAVLKEAEQAAEKDKKVQQYVQFELRKAAEDHRNVSTLLAANTGQHGFFGSGKETDYCCNPSWEPLPTLATDQTCFMKRYLEHKGPRLSMADTNCSRLPPLTRAPKWTFTAKGLVGGRAEGSNYGAKDTGVLPRLDTSQRWSTNQHKANNKVKTHLPTHLPPISNLG